ncbi:hypothetical protein EV401DRAFT_1887328 [Pisolithus croceorrhizus]|nr:hypothetical protein EV401DRAFT_1887328 [Pisolithus croceorrhizus]
MAYSRLNVEDDYFKQTLKPKVNAVEMPFGLVDQDYHNKFTDLLKGHQLEVIMVGGFSMVTTKLLVRVKVVFSGRAIGGTHCFRPFEDINWMKSHRVTNIAHSLQRNSALPLPPSPSTTSVHPIWLANYPDLLQCYEFLAYSPRHGGDTNQKLRSTHTTIFGKDPALLKVAKHIALFNTTHAITWNFLQTSKPEFKDPFISHSQPPDVGLSDFGGYLRVEYMMLWPSFGHLQQLKCKMTIQLLAFTQRKLLGDIQSGPMLGLGLTTVPAGARDNNVVELAQTSVQAEQGGHFSFQLRDPPHPTYVGSQSLNTFQGCQMNSSVTTKKGSPLSVLSQADNGEMEQVNSSPLQSRKSSNSCLSDSPRQLEFLSRSESENFYPHHHVREDGDDIDFCTDTKNPSLHSPSGDSAANGFQEYVDKRVAASIPETTQCTTLQHSTPPQSSYIQQKHHLASNSQPSVCFNLLAPSTGDSQHFQSLKRQCLAPPEQPEEDATDPKGDSTKDQVHCGRYSRNAKGTIPIKPTLIAFYPPLWMKLLNLAKAHMQLYVVGGQCQEVLMEVIAHFEAQGWEVKAGWLVQVSGNTSRADNSIDLKKVAIKSLHADYNLYPPTTAKTEEQCISAVKKKANDLLSMARYLYGEPDGKFAEFQEYVPYRVLALVAAMVHALLSSFRKHGINNSAQVNSQDVDKAYNVLNETILDVLDHPHHGPKLNAMLTEWAQSGMTGYVMKHKPMEHMRNEFVETITSYYHVHLIVILRTVLGLYQDSITMKIQYSIFSPLIIVVYCHVTWRKGYANFCHRGKSDGGHSTEQTRVDLFRDESSDDQSGGVPECMQGHDGQQTACIPMLGGFTTPSVIALQMLSAGASLSVHEMVKRALQQVCKASGCELASEVYKANDTHLRSIQLSISAFGVPLLAQIRHSNSKSVTLHRKGYANFHHGGKSDGIWQVLPVWAGSQESTNLPKGNEM